MKDIRSKMNTEIARLMKSHQVDLKAQQIHGLVSREILTMMKRKTGGGK